MLVSVLIWAAKLNTKEFKCSSDCPQIGQTHKGDLDLPPPPPGRIAGTGHHILYKLFLISTIDGGVRRSFRASKSFHHHNNDQIKSGALAALYPQHEGRRKGRTCNHLHQFLKT